MPGVPHVPQPTCPYPKPDATPWPRTKPRPRIPLPNTLTHIAPLPLRRTFFRSTFQQLQSGLFASNPAAFPASVFTLPRFLWAVAAVRARSHAPLEGQRIAVVPLVDLVGVG